MHIFLTGPIQVGKSTVIQKTLSLLGDPPLGGFRTVSITGPDTQRLGAFAEVYLTDPNWPPVYDRDHLIAIRWGGVACSPFPAPFDRVGARLLTDPPTRARLLLMDELGLIEQGEQAFVNGVLGALDGDRPVLGVVKPIPSPWLDRVRNHPSVRVIPVDPDNRDRLPREVAALLAPCLAQG